MTKILTKKNFSPRSLFVGLCVCLQGFVLSCVNAQGFGIGTSDAPTYISSERWELTEKRSQWDGNVRIAQGKAILTANTLVGSLDDAGEVVEAIATGAVRYSNGEQAIAGKRGVYSRASRTITITDEVIVTQGKNVFTAGKATYWIDTGKVVFAPAAGKRVRGIFYTDSDLKLPDPTTAPIDQN